MEGYVPKCNVNSSKMKACRGIVGFFILHPRKGQVFFKTPVYFSLFPQTCADISLVYSFTTDSVGVSLQSKNGP